MRFLQEIFNKVFDETSQAIKVTGNIGGSNVTGNIDDSNVASDNPRTIRLSYDAKGNVIYKGEAAPGSSTSDPVWKIEKYEYDANGNVTAVLFAEGTADFDKVWDNRESYNYL